ncbi:MAG: SDR family oxidoreductase [Desulfarculus sp.]|nr:MAG: SDR family oxidoreductase [Desulfarculus sp.]
MSPEQFNIAGKVVVITGGLGQLGSQYARELLGRGALVAVLDRQVSDPERRRIFGDLADDRRLLCLAADVTRRDSLEQALAGVQERWGAPHGLINNAALDSPPDAPVQENGPFETYPEASWDRVMEVNAKGVFLCCQVFGGTMAQAGRGSIINICSTYGLVSPDQRLYAYRRAQGQEFFKPVAYSASKSALLNLTRYLATYWGERGVRVNCLTLGGVYNNQDQQFVEAYESRVPLGRMARPEEYNGAVVFLLSDASAYMTGANLVMDGGWTAW